MTPHPLAAWVQMVVNPNRPDALPPRRRSRQSHSPQGIRRLLGRLLDRLLGRQRQPAAGTPDPRPRSAGPALTPPAPAGRRIPAQRVAPPREADARPPAEPSPGYR